MSTEDTVAETTPPKRGCGRPAGFVMTEQHKAKISKAQIRRHAIRKYVKEQHGDVR